MSTFEHTAVSTPGALDHEAPAIVAARFAVLGLRALLAALLLSTMRLQHR